MSGLPDYIIHYDESFRGGYRIGVNRENLVEIFIGDRENENGQFAESLIRKHRRFLNRRLRLNEANANREAPPPEPGRRQALQFLKPEFESITREMQLPLWSLTVRRATSRWGSCSHQTRRIMLNLQAVHLPPELRRYLIVHELAHIKHRGHDRAFWKFVEQFDPQFRKHRRSMRESFSYLLRAD